MNKLRIAIAGAGLIGQAHMRAAQTSPTCSLCAVVDPSPGSVGLAAKAGVAHFQSLEELIARDRPDGVIIATPNALHVPHALTCIDAGLPLLLEKPIAPDVAEARALVEIVERRGAKLLIGHHRAHSPIMARARQVIDSGALGRLVAVMGSAVFYKPDHYFDDAPWRRQAGGGPILINMIHEVHNLRMLCGEIDMVQAIASSAVRGHPVEDTVAISMRFVGGALGTFMLSDTAACARSWEQTARENPAYASYPDEDCYVIAGTRGSLSVPTMRVKSYARAEDRSWWKPFDIATVDLVREDPLKLQLEHLGALIRGDVAPLVSARDGLNNLIVTEAITQAARSGRAIDLPQTNTVPLT